MEIFLQHVEHFHIRPLLESKQILFYACYIDNIIIIYDTESTYQDTLVQYTNSMHDNLQFNPTQESNDCINFLDLTIITRISHLETDIYQKPTTDTTIHFLPNHPNEHKLAAYRYYIERMLNLPLNTEHQKREWLTILCIAQPNGFPPTTI